MTATISSEEIISTIKQEVDNMVKEIQSLKDSPRELIDARSFQQLEDEVHSKCTALADKIVAMNLQEHLSGKKK